VIRGVGCDMDPGLIQTRRGPNQQDVGALLRFSIGPGRRRKHPFLPLSFKVSRKMPCRFAPFTGNREPLRVLQFSEARESQALLRLEIDPPGPRASLNPVGS